MMSAPPGKSSLFIGDLAIFCSERDIEEIFAPYGEIQEIKIMRSEETSRNLSYGFIKFTTPQSAKLAMAQLNGVILCGRPLRIRWATYKSKLGAKEPKQDVLETSPVHVSFISYQIDKLVTEESLRALFSQYGEVVDASIKKSMIDQDMRRQSGYGFVHYSITNEGIQAAIRAASSLDDITVESVNYKCSLSHNLNKYLTGELAMPGDDPVVSAPHTPGSAHGHGHGPHGSGFSELDSDQYFGAPSPTYGAPQMPQGGGGYRPGMATSHSQPNLSAYGQQYGAGRGSYGPPQAHAQHQPQHLIQHSHSNRYAQIYRPNAPPPPAHVRAQSYGSVPGGYPPVHPELAQHQHQHHPLQPDPRQQQHQYDSSYGRYPEPPADPRYPAVSPGSGGQQRFFAEDPHQGGYGQPSPTGRPVPGAPPRSYGAPQQAGGNMGGAGAYGRPNQYSSGSATMAALGSMQPRNNAPTQYGGLPGQYGARGAPSPTAQQAQGGTDASNRWTAGSYNITPPSDGTGALGAMAAQKPSVLAPGRQFAPGQQQPRLQQPPAQQPQQASSYFQQQPGGPTQQQGQAQARQFGNDPRDMALLTGGMAGMSMHGHAGQPMQQHHAPQGSMSTQPWQQVAAPPQHQLQLQPPQNQPFATQSVPQFGLAYAVTQPNGSVTVHASPPCSPLAAYSASPTMGSGQLAYNPFLGGGFSPLISTVQSYVPVAASPLMSPAHMMTPRDVSFEENISNAHNLFTPAQFHPHSPLIGQRDLHYSPAMYQGGISNPMGGVFNPNGATYPVGGDFGGGRFPGPQGTSPRKALSKSKRSPPTASATLSAGDAGHKSLSSSTVTAATTTDSSAATATGAAEGVATTASTEASAVRPETTMAAGDAALESGESFFGAVPADGSPLESLEAETEGGCGLSDSGSPEGRAAEGSELDAADGVQVGVTGGTPSKGGTSRRNVISKHTRQLMA